MADFRIDSLGLVDLTVQLEEALIYPLILKKLKTLQTMDEMVAYFVSLEKSSGSSIRENSLRAKLQRNHFSFLILYFISGLAL
jgi:hypothetical protein